MDDHINNNNIIISILYSKSIKSQSQSPLLRRTKYRTLHSLLYAGDDEPESEREYLALWPMRCDAMGWDAEISSGGWCRVVEWR